MLSKSPYWHGYYICEDRTPCNEPASALLAPTVASWGRRRHAIK